MLSALIAAASTVLAQLDNTVYYIYQSESDVACGQAAVAIQGYLMDESFTLQRATSGTCSAEALCMLSPSSDGCLELTNSEANTASVSVSYAGGGGRQILECDTGNSDIGRDLCVESPLPCSESPSYPSCSYTLLTGQDLVDDPSVLSSTAAASSDDANVRNTGYTLYYSDEDCTALAALRGAVLETTNTLVGVDASVSCDASMACLLNPLGPSCAALPKQEEEGAGGTSSYMSYKNGTLSSCDAATGDCVATDPQGCAVSKAFPNCYE